MQSKAIDKARIRTAALFNVACMTAFFGCSWFLFYEKQMLIPFNRVGNSFVLLLFGIIYLLCFVLYGTLRISVSRVSELLYNQALSLVIADIIMYIVIVLLCRNFQSVFPLFMALVAQCCVAMFWSLLIHRWYFSTHKPKRTVIIWDVRHGISGLINDYGLQKRYQVVGKVHVKKCIKDLDGYLDGVQAVFLPGVHSTDRNKIIKYCVLHDIDAYVIPRIGDMIMCAARPVHLFNLPVMKLERYSPSASYAMIKRAFDVLLSGIALIILSPLMLIVSILIKATDGGTVLYKQRRLTINGKEFEILKFRSMRMDAEKDGVARLSTGSADDRITPIGRFIRAVRIDELPQLINILKGEMSIVGPRPERPEIVAEYEEHMPEFRLRLQVKAGLTGYAQVYGRYNTTPYDKLLMDLGYIANPSLAEDLRICMATIKILFMPESTTGVSEGQRTALSTAELAEKMRSE